MECPAARGGAETSLYDVLARIELPKPGKYELRLSVHSAATDDRGSIYLDVDVPDFRRAKVSLSGVLLESALAATPISPAGALRDIAPIRPTTERTFTSGDRVVALARVYQGGTDKLATIPLHVRILDPKGETVFELTDTLRPDRFDPSRAADYRFVLPLEKLGPGEHLLTLETAIGKVTARRDVQFRVGR